MAVNSQSQSDKPVITDPKDHDLEGPGSLRWATGSKSPIFGDVLLNSVLNPAWCPSGISKESRDSRYTMALGAVAAFKPQDEIEGMIAAQAVAMHLGSMECFRRAMIPDQPGDAAARLRKDGASLARGMVEMVGALSEARQEREPSCPGRACDRPGGRAGHCGQRCHCQTGGRG